MGMKPRGRSREALKPGRGALGRRWILWGCEAGLGQWKGELLKSDMVC